MRKKFFKIYFLSFMILFLEQTAYGITEEFEDEINLYCLKLVYPQIAEIERQDNKISIILTNGKKIPYAAETTNPDSLDVSLRESMKVIYPLEPERPDTKSGFAPGRKRAYEFFEALYGSTPDEVGKNLSTVNLRGKAIKLAKNAADALEKGTKALDHAAQKNIANKNFLVPEGGYYWRKIAGEEHMSAHSYGLALDVGVKHSPYWRWAKIQPHPLQKTYPEELVKIFERNGFIWGGKWHEYDLMHYEYRPELICKAHLMKLLQKRKH